MEYQKMINLLDNAPNQPTKFRTKNWVEINHNSRGTYSSDCQIKFKTSMLRSDLCDYSDAYILVSGAITVPGAVNNDAVRRLDERNKGVIFAINNAQIDNAKYIDAVMPMYNLIKYTDNYSKASGCLWKYYRDDPNDNITQSKSFKCKIKTTGKTPAVGNTKDVE